MMKSYAKHGDANYNSATAAGCEADGEPCFTIRAQDMLSGAVVRHWAELAQDNGSPLAEEAFKIADAMDEWPAKHLPD